MRSTSSTSPLQRYARPAIGIIASLGAIETAFLTWVELSGQAAAVCPTSGCETVLTSDYAMVMGVPLPLFGCIAYLTMAIAAFLPSWLSNAAPKFAIGEPTLTSSYRRPSRPIETRSAWVLVIGGAIMATVSSYLLYILATQLHAVCPYCIASALFSFTIFSLAIAGHAWEDVGNLGFTLAIVATVTLTGTLGIFANVQPATAANPPQQATPGRYTGAPITTHSDEDSIALATHLRDIGARQFGAYWCPHCHTQKQLFGSEAFALIDYVECDPDGVNSRTKVCRSAEIHSYPTWEINGEFYEGIHELAELADLSGYSGSRNFSHTLANLSTQNASNTDD